MAHFDDTGLDCSDTNGILIMMEMDIIQFCALIHSIYHNFLICQIYTCLKVDTSHGCLQFQNYRCFIE